VPSPNVHGIAFANISRFAAQSTDSNCALNTYTIQFHSLEGTSCVIPHHTQQKAIWQNNISINHLQQ